MTTKLKIVLASSAAILLLLVAGFAWLLYTLFTGPFSFLFRDETPKDLREPRVTVGSGLLSRTQFAKFARPPLASPAESGLGTIQDVAVGELDPHRGLDVVVAGRFGAAVLDRRGAKLSQVRFDFARKDVGVGPFRSSADESSLGDIRIIDVEGDGVCEYVARGGIDGAAVFDHDGRRLWGYGKFEEGRTSIDDLAAGDLDGDGALEFVSLWDKTELFDRYGKKLWEQPQDGPFYQSEIVDTDGDGVKEIVQSAGGDLVVRDAKGQIVRKVEMPFYFSHFSLCQPPGAKSPPQILAVEDGKLWLTDFAGNVVAQFDAPLSEFTDTKHKTPYGEYTGTSAYHSRGTWVRLSADQPEYLAVVTNFAAVDRSVFYLYSRDGTLVYQEVLSEECDSIAVLPPEDKGGAESLLVGGDETIWQYHWQDAGGKR